MPDRVAGEGVDGEDLVGAGYVEDSTGGKGRGFEAEVRDGKHPLQLEGRNVSGVDLLKKAVTVAGVIAVVREPVAGFGRAPGDFPRGLGAGHRGENGVRVEAAQVVGEGGAVAGRQIGKRGHTRGGVAALQISTQLIGRLFGDARIHGEAGSFGGAARIFAVAARAGLVE